MTAILTPIALLYVVVLVAITRLYWKQRECGHKLKWVATPFVLLTLIHSSPAAFLALGSLEWQYPPTEVAPNDGEVIVVLSGLTYPADQVRRQSELGYNTLSRCLYAADLHRAFPKKTILVSGGPSDEGCPSDAAMMRAFLISQGVEMSRILVEDRSKNTFENAVETCAILREQGIKRIVLVTTASHMPRAAGCFRKQGFEVIPAPCGHLANEYHFSFADAIPDVKNASQFDEAWHEWLGLVFYRLRGRL